MIAKTFRYVNEAGSIVFSYADGFLINKPVGIDTLSVKLSQATGIGKIGSIIQSAVIQARPINISGKLVGDFQKQSKEKLLSVIRPDLKARFYADDYYLEVEPTETPTIGPEERFASFSFSVLAAYPYWQQDRMERRVLSGIAKRFPFPWNLTRAYRFGELMPTQFINVPNRGQLPVPFTVTFLASGACENPRITHVKTGKYLALNKTMESGEQIVVEITHGRTFVTSSVDGDIRGCLDLRSTFTRLSVGDNVVKPGADSGAEELKTELAFAAEIAGVSV